MLSKYFLTGYMRRRPGALSIRGPQNGRSKGFEMRSTSIYIGMMGKENGSYYLGVRASGLRASVQRSPLY